MTELLGTIKADVEANGDLYAAKIEAYNRKNQSKPVRLKGVKHNGSTKRFYEEVAVKHLGERQFAVTLSGRVIETVVTQSTLCVPTMALAKIIAHEWDSQIEFIKPHSMPLTHLTTLALDQVAKHRENMIDSMMKYCDFDSACLRDYECTSLVRLQEKHWDPVLKWMKEALGIEMAVTQPDDSPIIAIKQSADSRQKIQGLIEEMNDWELAVLDSLSAVSRSLSVSLAVMYGQLDVNRAYECSRLEENYQMRRYGRVDGVFGHGVEIEYTRMKIAAARTFLNLGG